MSNYDRKQNDATRTVDGTVAGIGPGGWDSGKLAESQERHADYADYKRMGKRIGIFKPATPKVTAVAYRLYTEGAESLRESLVKLVSRYFEGATITYGVGLWQGVTEVSAVVDIIGTSDDLQAYRVACRRYPLRSWSVCRSCDMGAS